MTYTSPSAPSPEETPPVTPGAPAHDGLAVMALVSAFLLPPLGVILGHVSRHEAKGARRQPSALSTAALWFGYAFTVLGVVLIIALVAAAAHTGDQTDQFINCINNAVQNGTSTAAC